MRLSFWQQLQSAYRRDPAAALVELGKALLAIVGWAAFFVIVFFVALTAYDAIRNEASMEFGWLSDEDLRTRADSRKPIVLENLEPGGRRPGEGEPNEQPTDPGDGEGEKASSVEPRDLGIPRVGDRRKWALAIDAEGGNAEKKTAINAGLAWLGRQQHRDGHWQFSDDALYPDGTDWANWKTRTGATGLALLTLLGAGNTPDEGDHAEKVRKGLDWLIANQKPSGDFFDHRDLGRNPHFFAHSLATIAVCEAYAMSGDERLREPAERAIQFLVDSQHPTKGGWGYMPLNADETAQAHMWVTGWGLMAMFTARAAGIEVENEPFRRASQFIDSVMVDAGASYKDRPENAAAPSLTGQGLLSRQYLGWERDHPALLNGVNKLLAEESRPSWTIGKRDLYGWYHEAQVLHNMGGEEWEEWYAHLQSLVLANQTKIGTTKDGYDRKGSWDPEPRGPNFDIMDDHLGRLYSTCMALLILETPFRHMPVYPAVR